MWETIQTDLHAMFGIDVDAITNRSWPWLHTRILAVASTPGTRTHTLLM